MFGQSVTTVKMQTIGNIESIFSMTEFVTEIKKLDPFDINSYKYNIFLKFSNLLMK